MGFSSDRPHRSQQTRAGFLPLNHPAKKRAHRCRPNRPRHPGAAGGVRCGSTPGALKAPVFIGELCYFWWRMCEIGVFSTVKCCGRYLSIWNVNFHIPIGSMYGIYANIWGILMVNVTIYGTHGSYGISVSYTEFKSFWVKKIEAWQSSFLQTLKPHKFRVAQLWSATGVPGAAPWNIHI